MAETLLAIGTFLAGLGAGLALCARFRKPKVKIVVAAKRVDNRLMPNYTRAHRRAHKRAKRV